MLPVYAVNFLMFTRNYIITANLYRCSYDSVLSKIFLRKVNDCHMTYMFSPNINNHLSTSCNTFDITMEY